MSRREKLLVNALLWTAILVAAGLFGYLTLERRSAARERIGALEQQLAKLPSRGGDPAALDSRREALAERLAREQSRFYGPEEMDPYRFGALVRDLVIGEQLAIDRYQTVEVGDRTLLEFSLRGGSLGLMGFLQEVSLSPRYWEVSFLSISARAGTGAIQSVLRIGYETLKPVDR